MYGWREPIDWLFSGQEIPFLLKVLCTLFVGVVVIVYWRYYGPANFLWFSDQALLITCVALWLESSFLVSMQAASVIILELVWIVDFLTRLTTGVQFLGLADRSQSVLAS